MLEPLSLKLSTSRLSLSPGKKFLHSSLLFLLLSWRRWRPTFLCGAGTGSPSFSWWGRGAGTGACFCSMSSGPLVWEHRGQGGAHYLGPGHSRGQGRGLACPAWVLVSVVVQEQVEVGGVGQRLVLAQHGLAAGLWTCWLDVIEAVGGGA